MNNPNVSFCLFFVLFYLPSSPNSLSACLSHDGNTPPFPPSTFGDDDSAFREIDRADDRLIFLCFLPFSLSVFHSLSFLLFLNTPRSFWRTFPPFLSSLDLLTQGHCTSAFFTCAFTLLLFSRDVKRSSPLFFFPHFSVFCLLRMCVPPLSALAFVTVSPPFSLLHCFL